MCFEQRNIWLPATISGSEYRHCYFMRYFLMVSDVWDVHKRIYMIPTVSTFSKNLFLILSSNQSRQDQYFEQKMYKTDTLFYSVIINFITWQVEVVVCANDGNYRLLEIDPISSSVWWIVRGWGRPPPCCLLANYTHNYYLSYSVS